MNFIQIPKYIVYIGRYHIEGMHFYAIDLEEALEILHEMQEIDWFDYCGVKPFYLTWTH